MKQASIFYLILAFALALTSCNTGINKIFSKRTPHEAYAKKIASLPEAKAWLETSTKTLSMAQPVTLPYRQVGYFPADKARALSLLFTLKQGQRVHFTLSKKLDSSLIFADIFKQDTTGYVHQQAIDTAASEFFFDVESSGNYVLRLQPRLFAVAEYDLTAIILPSISFPVAGKTAKTGSYWGDARDGGQRSHEGVDIFAPKLTPVIASADGYITGVKEGGIGGKTVWLRVPERKVHLYYAHLDKQLVTEGDEVKRGDTLGLVGNTGNAQFTPPHLHFGIYTNRGPVDPLPFIYDPGKKPGDIPSKELAVRLQFKASKKRSNRLPGIDSIYLVPLAVNTHGYIVETPDGTTTYAPFSNVIVIKG